MLKKFCSKNGFTLPMLFVIVSAYFTFITFYFVIYSLKLQTIDALTDYYEAEIVRMMNKGESK
ncbi:hypothetical protein [Staphylococcus lutrae]|uniref:Uncharacterized protein n=1 Tax=Staphylococcus lutrae TaxID=155085 RepID=A0AAC9WID8_9STAP|nr:hypothetical protein [Staphylococcus lutrae]ARJ49845.1 hypothetical protein B5P37_00020 [Staphylococcus lutrae]PNZ37792.1 hypothetical protein CD134_05845 [Staphylococcus lutrae]